MSPRFARRWPWDLLVGLVAAARGAVFLPFPLPPGSTPPCPSVTDCTLPLGWDRLWGRGGRLQPPFSCCPLAMPHWVVSPISIPRLHPHPSSSPFLRGLTHACGSAYTPSPRIPRFACLSPAACPSFVIPYDSGIGCGFLTREMSALTFRMPQSPAPLSKPSANSLSSDDGSSSNLFTFLKYVVPLP